MLNKENYKILKDKTAKFLELKEGVFDIKSKSTSRISEARMFIYSIIRKNYLNESLKSIGFNTGERNHSTVIKAIKKHCDLCEIDNDYKQKYLDFENYFVVFIKPFIEIKEPTDIEELTTKLYDKLFSLKSKRNQIENEILDIEVKLINLKGCRPVMITDVL